jgi:CRP-like cAMP-binding protein
VTFVANIEPRTVEAAPRNLLLSALPPDTMERWSPSLEEVTLDLGEALYEPGVTLSHAYFPITALVSLLYVMRSGASTEIAVIGNDGVVGVSLFMGGGSTPSRAVVQSAGTALRLPAAALLQEFARGGFASHLMLRYTQALITQMTQTAACNRHHSIDQQLCRWLLLSLDQRDGLIRYSRGRIRVLDREGLEARVCECYDVVRREYGRLMPECAHR